MPLDETPAQTSLSQLAGGVSTTFAHEPIERTQTSIRLIEVSPTLSTKGSVQCRLSHSKLEASVYVCLSYRWGPELPTKDISINGKTFTVRQNLYDFLETYRCETHIVRHIWIDALCIDQTNIQERNHQVEQMGQVFSNAQCVYIWLGEMPAFRPVFQSLSNWKHMSYQDLGAVRSNPLISTYIYNNEYWGRAWVTQEISLAKQIVVFLDNKTISFLDLLNSMRSFYLLAGDAFRKSAFFQYGSTNLDPKKWIGQHLVTLLSHFRGKHCGLTQDRVFSLLSLCSPASRIPVDYSSSRIDLMRMILDSCAASLCLCDVLVVAHTLDLASTRDDTSTDPAFKDFYVDIRVEGFQLEPTRQGTTGYASMLRCRHYKQCLTFGTFLDQFTSVAMETFYYTNFLDLKAHFNERFAQIPWIYQNMEGTEAVKMIFASEGRLDIVAPSTSSETYTIRVSIDFLARLLPQPDSICVRAPAGVDEDGTGPEGRNPMTESLWVRDPGRKFKCGPCKVGMGHES